MFEVNDLSKVLSLVKHDFCKCLKFYEEMGLRKSKKQLSEDLSGLLETTIERYYDDAVAPKKDSEPDILKDGIAVEIKSTAGEDWRGGAFSKRPGYYLLVGWQHSVTALVGSPINLFVAGIDLKESDWSGGLKNDYYATDFNKKALASRLDDTDIYMGNIYEYYRGKQKCVKIVKS